LVVNFKVNIYIASYVSCYKMLESLLYAFISVGIVSLISLVGVLTFAISGNFLRRILILLVSFAAGALLGDVFIHLLPEVVKEFGFRLEISLYVLVGILIFFILEKFIQWRHCHMPTTKAHAHPVALMNLIGDGLHNLIDGMIIAGSYIASIQLGIATTIAVVLHEIPQEMGDFGILLHGGFNKVKALFFNFVTALFAVLGAVIAFIIGSGIENFSLYMIPITAGGFIYIAGSDLIPELHKTCVPASKSVAQLIAFVLGMFVMLLLLLVG